MEIQDACVTLLYLRKGWYNCQLRHYVNCAETVVTNYMKEIIQRSAGSSQMNDCS
jgi:hypothetical protein